ncbi:MAG: hypothetical protein HUK04_05530 [Bacteroidaceae bacterium]|nr:hypothetical protein [Bacteroidaceae bacterium]
MSLTIIPIVSVIVFVAGIIYNHNTCRRRMREAKEERDRIDEAVGEITENPFDSAFDGTVSSEEPEEPHGYSPHYPWSH